MRKRRKFGRRKRGGEREARKERQGKSGGDKEARKDVLPTQNYAKDMGGVKEPSGKMAWPKNAARAEKEQCNPEFKKSDRTNYRKTNGRESTREK